MAKNTDKIRTTHVGSLVRPAFLAEEERARMKGEKIDQAKFEADLKAAVIDVVRMQHEAGIDIPSDGEFGKSSFIGYLHERVTGFTPTDRPSDMQVRTRQGRLRKAFPKFHAPPPGAPADQGGGGGGLPGATFVECTGPVTYIGQANLKRDLDNFTAALAKIGKKPQDGAFYAAIAPHNFGRGENRHYKTEREFFEAVGKALAVEYRQIVDAGFDLQIDAPVGMYEQLEWSMEEFRAHQQMGIEIMNEALAGIDPQKVRYHICFGSWNSPHTFDPPLEDFVDIVLGGRIGQLSVEGSNARHAHEVDVWRTIKLPDQMVLIPGVITHMTYVVEHPKLVAKRIKEYASLLGKDRVIASSDCGPGRVQFVEVQWAKLKTLSEGARLATDELWGRTPAMAGAR